MFGSSHSGNSEDSYAFNGTAGCMAMKLVSEEDQEPEFMFSFTEMLQDHQSTQYLIAKKYSITSHLQPQELQTLWLQPRRKYSNSP